MSGEANATRPRRRPGLNRNTARQEPRSDVYAGFWSERMETDLVRQCQITARIGGLPVAIPPPIYYPVRWQRYDMNRGGRERTIGHDEFDPTGTLALIGLYFVVLTAMWLFTYFVEFVGGAPTVTGTLPSLVIASMAATTGPESPLQR